MNIVKLKTFPFHFLLLPLFFVWHVCNAYFGLIPFRYTSKYLLYYTGLAVLLFILGKLFFRNNVKAGIWSTLLMLPFFFWGAMHDFLRNIDVNKFLSSYSFLLPLLLLITLLLFIVLRKKKNFSVFNQFLNLLLFIFIFIELSISIYHLSNNQIAKNNLAHNNQQITISQKKIQANKKPDIFFILFDEYASSNALKKYLNFDNNSLDSTLEKKKFFTIKKSKSNYNSTPFSIASLFHLNYFNTSLEDHKTVPLELLKAQKTFTSSPFFNFLESQGYTIKNYGLFDIKNHDAPHEPLFNHNIDDAFTKETFLSRIKSEILWRFNRSLSFLYRGATKKNEIDLNANFYNLKKTLTELSFQEEKPKFIYTHILLPHGKYFLNRDGKKRATSYTDDFKNIRDSLYLDQLVYANKWISTFADKASLSSKRPRIIIIAGDHGRRDNIPKNKITNREKQFMNLSTIFFSDKNYSTLNDSITSVNIFRHILNKYFDTELPILKDSTIYIQ